MINDWAKATVNYGKMTSFEMERLKRDGQLRQEELQKINALMNRHPPLVGELTLQKVEKQRADKRLLLL